MCVCPSAKPPQPNLASPPILTSLDARPRKIGDAGNKRHTTSHLCVPVCSLPRPPARPPVPLARQPTNQPARLCPQGKDGQIYSAAEERREAGGEGRGRGCILGWGAWQGWCGGELRPAYLYIMEITGGKDVHESGREGNLGIKLSP